MSGEWAGLLVDQGPGLKSCQSPIDFYKMPQPFRSSMKISVKHFRTRAYILGCEGGTINNFLFGVTVAHSRLKTYRNTQWMPSTQHHDLQLKHSTGSRPRHRDNTTTKSNTRTKSIKTSYTGVHTFEINTACKISHFPYVN